MGKGPELTFFFHRRDTNGQQIYEICLPPPIIGKCKSTMRCYLTPVSMAFIKKKKIAKDKQVLVNM